MCVRKWVVPHLMVLILTLAGPDAEVTGTMQNRLQQLMGPDAQGFAAYGPAAVAEGPLTPDHIVYAKAFPFKGELAEATLASFKKRHGYKPRIIVQDHGVYAVGTTQAKAQMAMDLALDGAQVLQLAEAFGGTQYLGDDARQFIENWEVESYRESISTK